MSFNISFKHIIKPCINSYKGLKYLLNHERAFQFELLLLIILLPVIFLVNQTAIEKVLLLSSLILVLIVETINSAIEKTVDRISTKRHSLSAAAKDIGSFAVLLSIILASIIWFVILY